MTGEIAISIISAQNQPRYQPFATRRTILTHKITRQVAGEGLCRNLNFQGSRKIWRTVRVEQPLALAAMVMIDFSTIGPIRLIHSAEGGQQTDSDRRGRRPC